MNTTGICGLKAMVLLPLSALLFAAPMGGTACPIPVYQYSLEWWERDPYEVYVFSQDDLTKEQQAVIDRLQAITQGNEGAMPVNLRLRRVQADSKERLYAHSALQGQTPEALPWMVVYYPATASNRRAPVWSGELNQRNFAALVDSPVRQRISELLINRTSVVWLLLESGNQRADKQAADLLKRELDRLQRTLVLPDLGSWGLAGVTLSPIEFARLSLSRADPAEQLLIAMLTNSERDLKDYAQEPMVFPIFGRGLIMEALIGGGINPPMIRKTAEFLTGPCSCTVKSLNPGTDLLTNADWAGRITPLSIEATTQPGGLGGFLDSAEKAGAF
jgi:hypothetical protein